MLHRQGIHFEKVNGKETENQITKAQELKWGYLHSGDLKYSTVAFLFDMERAASRAGHREGPALTVFLRIILGTLLCFSKTGPP